jgi:Na+/H+ antiporter NhaD/arsenite permease-like protein
VNYIISVVFATNIGSSWTVLGNPIGILIALRSGLTFEDFIKVALPIGVVSLFSLIVISLLWQRGELRKLREEIKKGSIEEQKRFLSEWAKLKTKALHRQCHHLRSGYHLSGTALPYGAGAGTGA